MWDLLVSLICGWLCNGNIVRNLRKKRVLLTWSFAWYSWATWMMSDNRIVVPLLCRPFCVAMSSFLVAALQLARPNSTGIHEPIYSFRTRSNSHRPGWCRLAKNAPLDLSNFCTWCIPATAWLFHLISQSLLVGGGDVFVAAVAVAHCAAEYFA